MKEETEEKVDIDEGIWSRSNFFQDTKHLVKFAVILQVYIVV